MKCSVVNCNKIYKSNAAECSFFQFPTDSALRKKWISFCGHKRFNPDKSLVCMHHFKAEDFANTMQYEMGFSKKRLLKVGVVPTINSALAQADENTYRVLRIERRNNKKIVEDILKNHEEKNILQSTENIPVGTSENMGEIETLESIQNEHAVTTVEKLGEIETCAFQKSNAEIFTMNENVFHNLTLKVETLEKEIVILKNEKKLNDAALKNMKEKMEKMEKVHKYEKTEMEKCIAKSKYDLDCIEKKLQVFFTKGQIKKLKNDYKRQNWSEDDIAHSITLYSVSPKMYRLMYRNQFPLPAIRTLQWWAQKLQINRGLITPVFKILQASNHMNEVEKLCVLSFDEMKIKSSYCYDKETDTTLAPANYVQVCMLRGKFCKFVSRN